MVGQRCKAWSNLRKTGHFGFAHMLHFSCYKHTLQITPLPPLAYQSTEGFYKEELLR